MKLFKRAFLASLLTFIWALVFSSATVSLSAAQQDEMSQGDAAPDAQVGAPEQVQVAPPPPDSQAPPEQGQVYAKPNAGRPMEPGSDQPMEVPQQAANGSANQSISPPADLNDQPSNGQASNGQPVDQPANEPTVDESDRNDPPGRVARLQYITGSVSIQPHGTDQWVQGSVNRPLTIADNIWADKNSRAELNVGTGLIRIGSESSLTLTNVSDNSVQLSLHQGAMNLHVRHLFAGEIYEVDTPNQTFTILKTGDYRFDVDPSADTTLVTVWRGEGEATGQGPSVRVKEHEQVRFSNGNTLAHDIHRAPSPDGFDDWCVVRDRREDSSVSARYVSPDVIGSEDLDQYGTWRTTPQYGAVWVPTAVQPGWAPYAYGHWVYISPWGWTWVDDAPWGFAPFHYGRWVSFGGYWGWAPGPYYYGGWGRGWYAPALVSWFGGSGWGVGIGFGFGGGYGWCPLGFGEPFRPWYRAGWGYFRGVNIYNTRINNINTFHNFYRSGSFGAGGGFHYANLNAHGGFTAVSRGTLERGLPVGRNAVHVSANVVRTAPALGRVNATATMQSRLGPNAGRPAASPRGFAAQSNTRASFSPSSASGGRFVPRASSASSMRSEPAQTSINQSPPTMNRGAYGASGSGRSVPRPPSGWSPSQTNSTSGAAAQSYNGSSSRLGTGTGGSRNNVPRPTGQVLPAPRSYSSNGGSSSNSSRSYGSYPQGSRGYSSGSRSYNSPAYSGRSYGGSPYGGGRAYSAPVYSNRSPSGGAYGGGRSYSSYGSSHSSGAGSHGSSGGGSRGSGRGGRR